MEVIFLDTGEWIWIVRSSSWQIGNIKMRADFCYDSLVGTVVVANLNDDGR